jgi:hypothetical protein
MSYAAGLFLAIVAVGVAILLAVQVNEYLRGRSLLTPPHFLLRIVTGICLILVVGGIYAGALWRFGTPWTELAYWTSLLLAAVLVALLATVDLRMMERAKHRKRAELYRRLAEAEAHLRRPKDKDDDA